MWPHAVNGFAAPRPSEWKVHSRDFYIVVTCETQQNVWYPSGKGRSQRTLLLTRMTTYERSNKSSRIRNVRISTLPYSTASVSPTCYSCFRKASCFVNSLASTQREIAKKHEVESRNSEMISCIQLTLPTLPDRRRRLLEVPCCIESVLAI